MIKHQKALLELASKLNKQNVNWGLGASYMLFLNGMDTTVNDIDIIVDIKDKSKLDTILQDYSYDLKDRNDQYLTKYFYSLVIDSIDFDIMIDFKVKHDGGIYSYPVNDDFIDKTIILDNESIPLCSIKEWLNAYKVMGRTSKVMEINKFLELSVK